MLRRGILLYIALLVMLIAVLGALLNPFALFMGALPVDTSGFLGYVNTAKSYISNFLLWLALGLLFLMPLVIMRGRWQRRNGVDSSARRDGTSPIGSTGDSTPMKIAVAITAYDHADCITRVVEEFRAQEGVVEVIVIDNNSRDDTAALAASAGARVVHETHQGYGFTCIRGLQEALKVPEANTVVLTEGDGTFTASDLTKFQAYVHEADMIVGTRVVPGLVESGSQMDHFFTWGNMFASALLRLKFWDLQFLGAASLSDLGCTYRAIRREALEKIIDELDVGGMHFSPHMMMVMLARGLSIVEIPVTFRRRVGESKGASQSVWKGLTVGLAMIWHIMTYRPRRHEDVDVAQRLGREGVAG